MHALNLPTHLYRHSPLVAPASYLAGREREKETIASIASSFGVPVVTAASAVVDALNSMGAKNIALSSPYPEALTQSSIGYWKSHGLKVTDIATAQPDPTQFHPIYSMSALSAAGTLDELERVGAHSRADAILMLGTGMPTLGPLLQRSGQGGPADYLLHVLPSVALCSVNSCRGRLIVDVDSRGSLA